MNRNIHDSRDVSRRPVEPARAVTTERSMSNLGMIPRSFSASAIELSKIGLTHFPREVGDTHSPPAWAAPALRSSRLTAFPLRAAPVATWRTILGFRPPVNTLPRHLRPTVTSRDGRFARSAGGYRPVESSRNWGGQGPCGARPGGRNSPKLPVIRPPVGPSRKGPRT